MRPDLYDRGARFITIQPGGCCGGGGGTPGVFTVETTTWNYTSVSFSKSGNVAKFTTTDYDTNTVNVTQTVNNPRFDWTSNNGGMTVMTEETDTVCTIQCRSSGLDTLCITGDWPSLTSIDADTNPNVTTINQGNWANIEDMDFTALSLTEFETFEWPSLNSLYIAGASHSLTSFNTYEWPNMTVLSLVSSGNLAGMNIAQDWPSLETINIRGCSLNTFEPGTWNRVKYIDCGYISFATMNNQSTWTALEKLICIVAYMTSVTTHNTWTNLQELWLGWGRFTSGTFETHNEWTDLEWLYLNKSAYTLNALTIHPGWTKFDYLDFRESGIPAADIDTIIEDVDAIGTSGGNLDYRNSTYAADSNRSASANTAISNLVGRGWTVLR